MFFRQCLCPHEIQPSGGAVGTAHPQPRSTKYEKGIKMNSDNLKSFLIIKLELWETYHNHKENMANAGFLVQLSLFGSLITQALWPPAWVAKVIALPSLGTFVVYFMLWFLIHYYTRWQLINKRVAAMYYAGFDKALLYFSTHELTNEDLSTCNATSHTHNKIRDLISKLIYIPGGFTKMDASVEGLPNFIARDIQKMFKIGSGAESLEMLMTYASIVLMIVAGTKIFIG
ncbi:hypothetical protein HGA64_04420 [Candidatus Falkowbacteria bacterium]|nr:hypothetical protein [Candidatus Falkowbacteria bacterium]